MSILISHIHLRTIYNLSQGPNYFHTFLPFRYASATHTKSMSTLTQLKSQVWCSFNKFNTIFHFDIHSVEFYARYNDTKQVLGNKLFIFVFCVISLAYSVIRDSAPPFHPKQLSMLRTHFLIAYSLEIFYSNTYCVEFYVVDNDTKPVLGTKLFICVFLLFL